MFDCGQYTLCITSAHFLIQWFRFSFVNNTDEKAPQFDQRKSMNEMNKWWKKTTTTQQTHNEIESAHRQTQTTLTVDSVVIVNIIILYRNVFGLVH